MRAAGEPTIFRYEHDGLTLAGHLYGDLDAGVLPFVCLSGLTRNGRDFHRFALAIQRGEMDRPVIAFDYRGRGLSDRAADAATYTLPNEMADVLAGLAHLGVLRAVFVGTSRGALIVHLLAASHPTLVAGAVLNDAGPKLEIEGLLAIKGYVGRPGTLPDWQGATALVAAINRPTFPALTDADFERMARAAFKETDAGIVADHDPRLADVLKDIRPDAPPPDLWQLFEALRPVPVLVVRGEHSMLLSRETVARMAAFHPALEAIEVAGQGHAPLLETAGLPERIAAFSDRVEEG
jgi:pimeloyl-ACP methyl ester carboxylesterase